GAQCAAREHSNLRNAKAATASPQFSRKSSGNHFRPPAGGGGAACGAGGGGARDWVGASPCSPSEGAGYACSGLLTGALGGRSSEPLRPHPASATAANIIAASMTNRANPNSGLCTTPTPPEP